MSNVSGYLIFKYLSNTSCLADVKPLLPIPLLYSSSYVVFPNDAKPTITSPSFMFELSITSSLFKRQTTVESTMIVLTKSPTSAVSPPEDLILIPNEFNLEITNSFPSMIVFITSPGINFLFLPIVEETTILSIPPTQIKSSMFIISESCDIPFQTSKSPVSFQYA